MRRLAASLLVVVALVAAGSDAAFAHANYARSDPAPDARLAQAPTRIVVGFSEKPSLVQSGLALLASDGRTLAEGGQLGADPTEIVLPVPALADGVYTVAWHTVSAVDGDTAHAYFAFVVGAGTIANGSSITQNLTQSGIGVTFTVAPAAPGENRFQAQVSGATNVTLVRLQFTPLDRDLGTISRDLVASGPSFTGTGFDLPFAGRYRATLIVRRRDILDDLKYEFPVTVTPIATALPSASAVAPGSSGAASSARNPSGPPLDGTTTAMLGGGLALLTIIAAYLIARRRR